ncbi:hypothetical protein XENTR_v10019185 [Xenopus tropicalis]|nr:hypothetical protein XENTR_v10019185 [Xenopus tropicalis]
MICYVLLLALVAPGLGHPPGRPGDGSAVFRPPPPPKGTGLPPSPPPKGTGLPPPVSHDLNKPSGHPEELRSAAPLPPKNPPKEPENGRNKSDLHHEKAAPTGVPHHTGEVPHHTGEVPHHTGEVPHHTGEVPHHTGEVPPHTGEVPPHTGAHSGSGEISHPPRPDITHKSNEEKRPEGFRTGAPLPPKKLEHGRHRRDLQYGKAIPTVVPHDTEEFYSGSGEISPPPRHGHSGFIHIDESREGNDWA